MTGVARVPSPDGRPHPQPAGPVAATPALSPVVEALMATVAPSSVVDLGPGDPVLVSEFRRCGVDDVVAVRPAGRPARDESIPGIAHDLRLPLTLDRRFDLAVALGTGAWLPPGAAPVLARSLVDAADVVAFAAVLPGLAPPGTPNARWPSWWDGLFADLGRVPHDVVRPRLWDDEVVDIWIRQGLVLYAPPGRFPATALPQPAQRRAVHPEAYHRALDDAEARRRAESALSARRAAELDADNRRLAGERQVLADDVEVLRRRPTFDPAYVAALEAAKAEAARTAALLRAGRAAAEHELSRGPSPELLVAATRRGASSSITRSVTAAFPVRRRLRRLIGPAAPLWDEAFYVSRTPEVLAAGLSPLWHYRRHGARLGRQPHPWFDPEWYVTRHPGAVPGGGDPVDHYLARGWRDGLDPHPLFASRWYGREHAAVDRWRRSPLEHYLERGRAAHLAPHPLLDTRWYLAAHPDVASAGHDPVDHFCRHGWREGRDPHPLFDVGWYLENNPDVADAGVNPLVHFLWFGWREGRDPHPLFDTASYLAAVPGVAGSRTDPLSHYLTGGAAAGASTGRFDTAWYVAQHPESAEDGRNPLVFFVETGRERGDPPLPPERPADRPVPG